MMKKEKFMLYQMAVIMPLKKKMFNVRALER